MNWRRGFFRLWIAASVLWIGGLGLFVVPAIVAPAYSTLSGTKASQPRNCDAAGEGALAAICRQLLLVDAEVRKRRAGAVGDLAIAGSLMVGPPVGLLLIGNAVGWVFGGFRRKGADGPGSNDRR